MPSLFAYIVAIFLLLGGGYAGLQWLAEPAPVANHAGKESLKSRRVTEQAQFSADMDGRRSYERGSVPSGAQSKLSPDAAADPQATVGQSEIKQVPTEKDPTKDVADVPRGGCMPFGITGKGELVFPMECQAILAQYGAGRAAPQPDPDDSTPAAKQAADGNR
jgi:hypothetical protein